MRNYIVKPILTEPDQQLNALTIQAHIDDDYYTIDAYPEDFILSGNAAQPSTAATFVSLPVGNERIPVVQFRNGFTDEVKFSWRSRKYWEKGNVEFKIYFTGSTGNTNNIKWQLRGYSHAIGESITAVSTLATDETVAGPTSALFLKSYTFSNYEPMSREMELMHLRLTRLSLDASDTYTGDVYLVLMKITLIPAMNQTGTKL
jgi:hypothetical protein